MNRGKPLPSPNIPDLAKTRQDLPLPYIRTGVLQPFTYYKLITQRFFILLQCVIYESENKNRK